MLQVFRPAQQTFVLTATEVHFPPFSDFHSHDSQCQLSGADQLPSNVQIGREAVVEYLRVLCIVRFLANLIGVSYRNWKS